MKGELSSVKIDSSPVSACPFCEGNGKVLHSSLDDLLFGAPGKWTFRKCLNDGCLHVWLDPVPLESQIHKAYKTYYTHATPGEQSADASSLTRQLRRRISNSVVGKWYRQRILGMYLSDVPPGRLLELGCGDGRRLLFFKENGWQVEGQEVDSVVVKNLRSEFNLPIHHGDLKTLALKAESYDAVIMNHVVEHLHDPVSVIRECRRLLKPRGRIVIVTPNSSSLGHLLYRTFWRGLEPPRHINIFNPYSLSTLATKSGFLSCAIMTSCVNAWIIGGASARLKRGQERPLTGLNKLFYQVKAFCFQLSECFLKLFFKNIGEECVMVVLKS